jgi:glucose-6-phosphate 1-dehydrogenase
MSVALVIFGATGDLAQRKLVPALFKLYQAKALPADFLLIGFGRKELSEGEFRQKFDVSPEFAECITYVHGAYDSPEGFAKLAAVAGERSIAFYFSTPPETYAHIIGQLDNAGLSRETAKHWRRVIVEKPFGADEASARALNDVLRKAFKEEQTFRIDHYLAKETVRQIPALRKAHAHKWDSKNIDHVQITISEELGIGERGGYYDQSGALRDMIQSHLLQVLALIAMELPAGDDAHDTRAAKIGVLKNIVFDELAESVVRGQYHGYTQEPGVHEKSATETFIALKFGIGTERWKGVPFYARSGKRMKSRFAEAHVVFKDASPVTLSINPRQGGNGKEAHEVLFPAVFAGDRSLFPSWDEIELCWRIVDRIIAHWAAEKPELHAHTPGTWGPAAADELLAKEGRKWIQP